MIFFRRKLKKSDPAREKVLREFEAFVGYRFKDINLLNTALTHPSYLNEKQITEQSHYERMEFLGDSVLGLTVASHLYATFPDDAEGVLSDIKSHVVSEQSLAGVARKMALGKYILLGTGEARTGGRRKNSILANVFEAIIGAIYLDGGYDKAHRYILKFAKHDIVVAPPDRDVNNFKGKLQKYTQFHFGADPHYTVLKEDGPSHSRTFDVVVHVKKEELGIGHGRSKKEAEQNAAKAGIQYFEEGRAPGIPHSEKKSKARKKKKKAESAE